MNKPDDPDTPIRVPVPPELSFGDTAFNPAFDVPKQYEWKTVAEMMHEVEEARYKLLQSFYEKHQRADMIVSNQNGVTLYAVYKSPYASHDEMVQGVFKQLRANSLNDWEREA